MDTNEVIPHRIDGDHVGMVLEFLAECIGQTCKAAIVHPHSEIGALDVTGRDMLAIWFTFDNFFLYAVAFSRAIAFLIISGIYKAFFLL